MNIKQLRDFIANLPDDLPVESCVAGGPSSAKRIVAYKFKDGSGQGLCVNSMGTHLSDDFYSTVEIIAILPA